MHRRDCSRRNLVGRMHTGCRLDQQTSPGLPLEGRKQRPPRSPFAKKSGAIRARAEFQRRMDQPAHVAQDTCRPVDIAREEHGNPGFVQQGAVEPWSRTASTDSGRCPASRGYRGPSLFRATRVPERRLHHRIETESGFFRNHKESISDADQQSAARDPCPSDRRAGHPFILVVSFPGNDRPHSAVSDD